MPRGEKSGQPGRAASNWQINALGVIAFMVHEVQMGKRTRMSFSRVEESLEMPDLIEVQKNSYQRFLQ